MAKGYLISNRTINDGIFGEGLVKNPRFFITAAAPGKRDTFASWKEVTLKEFYQEIRAEIAAYPVIPEELNEDQKHLTLFIHGFNNSWEESIKRYNQIQKELYSGASGLGTLILFSWPSNGRTSSSLPDREDARDSAPQLAELFVLLYQEISRMQQIAASPMAEDSALCKAKMSIIAHSMGNYVLVKAMAIASKRLTNPQLITLIHQVAMVAAEVANDIFQLSKPDDSDGMLMANLCYRISSLYTGLDSVLGASAGLKHFGTRRMGRSGLHEPKFVPDNVCEFNITNLIDNTRNAHSAVFEIKEARDLLREILRGVDRKILLQRFNISD
jgi:esterase/lipase superfamily enzyme